MKAAIFAFLNAILISMAILPLYANSPDTAIDIYANEPYSIELRPGYVHYVFKGTSQILEVPNDFELAKFEDDFTVQFSYVNAFNRIIIYRYNKAGKYWELGKECFNLMRWLGYDYESNGDPLFTTSKLKKDSEGKSIRVYKKLNTNKFRVTFKRLTQN